ncbi:MAG: hypothetical protein IJ426_01940 [Clostridia bacterium]|nr:hypothetical protein [Clostridia bacterium]
MRKIWFGISAIFYLVLTVICYYAMHQVRNFLSGGYLPSLVMLFCNAIICFYGQELRRFGIITSILGIILGAWPLTFLVYTGPGDISFMAVLSSYWAIILFLSVMCIISVVKAPKKEMPDQEERGEIIE